MTMRSAIIAAVMVAACATAANEPPREPSRRGFALERALAPPSDNDGGVRAQLLAMLGREDLFEHPQKWRGVCAPLMRNGVAVDPRDEIARRAAAAQIVIINEAHDSPQDRAFIADIAQRLRPIGFSVYAAETLSERAMEPERTWPRLDDGYFTYDPMFGALLRQARTLGYRIVAYEYYVSSEEAPSMEERMTRREEGQTRNLVTRIFEPEPQARVLIHVGYNHVMEREEDEFPSGVMMAQRLKATTGIDPLTIDMTRDAAAGDDFVFCDPDQAPARSVDIRLGTPAVTFEHGRPAWRMRAGQRPTAVPAALLHPGENTVVEARIASEPDEAVPVDRILLRPGETLPLLLAPGRYRVESWTQAGGWSAPVELSVE